MIRNFKAFVLASMAIMAMGAIAAQAAPAALFHSSAQVTALTSAPDGTLKNSHHVFDAAGGSITCGGPGVSFSATSSEKTPEVLTVTANYGPSTNCTFLGLAATVNMNGCDYLFNANGTVTLGGTGCVGVTFVVGSGVSECHVEVTPQTLPNAVTYKNNEAKTEVTVETHATGIKYHAKGPNCPLTGTREDGNYTTGNTWIKGENEETKTAASVWWE
jgi:hypothetical protein